MQDAEFVVRREVFGLQVAATDAYDALLNLHGRQSRRVVAYLPNDFVRIERVPGAQYGDFVRHVVACGGVQPFRERVVHCDSSFVFGLADVLVVFGVPVLECVDEVLQLVYVVPSIVLGIEVRQSIDRRIVLLFRERRMNVFFADCLHDPFAVYPRLFVEVHVALSYYGTVPLSGCLKLLAHLFDVLGTPLFVGLFHIFVLLLFVSRITVHRRIPARS